MIQARLTRVASHPEHGTFGTLVIDGQPICVTLEPYHRDNNSNVSSIPAGQYICKPYNSPKYPNTYEVTGVANRSHILFHAGNWDHDSRGCILLGESFSTIGADFTISESRRAMEEFITSVHGDFQLTITAAY